MPHIRTVIINAEDQPRLLAFWSGLLDVAIRGPQDQSIVWLEADTPGGVNLGIQQVASKIGTHTEAHVDVAVEDLDAAQQRIEDLGGRLVQVHRTGDGFTWRVVADPEDNEFCIFAE